MIDSFKGEFDFLSNFYPCEITFEGVVYSSVEHAYCAAKTEEIAIRIKIAEASTAGKAKKIGRLIELRQDWDKLKIKFMWNFLQQKFDNPELAAKLVATGDRKLIEGNWWGDTFWGVCKGEGKNVLGRMLMLIREQKMLEI